MTPFKQHLPRIAFALGSLGLVVCVAGMVGVWSLASRLNRTNQVVFEQIDRSLAAVQDRVGGARDRVQASKITTDKIGQSLKNWTHQEARQRLTSRLDVEEKAEQLGRALRQADQWLEVSTESIQGVQQAVELASSIGAPIDATLVLPLLEKLTAVRSQLGEATTTIDEFRERAEEITAGDTRKERIDQAARLALSVVATLGEIDIHLEEAADRLAKTRNKARRLKVKTQRWIVIATICALVLIAWMAVGQLSLCRHGWRFHP